MLRQEILTFLLSYFLTVEYFIERRVYDVFAINETLFAFDQPLLGT